jgi:hypothetical protein
MFKKTYANVNEPFFGWFKGSSGSDGKDGKDYENQFEFVLGKHDQTSRGNTGASRAMIKNINSQLVLNYMNDFKGGVVVDGASYCFIDTSNNKGSTCFNNDEMRGLKTGMYNNRYDLNLGGYNQVERGNSGASRALVKLRGDTSGNSMLHVNYDGDFKDGIIFNGSKFCFRNPVPDASGNVVYQCITARDLQKLYALIPR